MSWFDAVLRFLGVETDQRTNPTPLQPTNRPAPRPTPPANLQAPSAALRAQDPLFWGERSALSKQIITEQVYSVAKHIFTDGVKFDEVNAHWMVVPKYVLPRAWRGIARETSMMIVFPTDYPRIPPIGLYLRGDIQQSPAGNFYANAYHNAAKAPISQGWKWFCVYVNPGSWQPARYTGRGTWQAGDNLYTYLTLVKEALSGVDE